MLLVKYRGHRRARDVRWPDHEACCAAARKKISSIGAPDDTELLTGQQAAAGAASDGVGPAKSFGRPITRRYHAARCASGLAPARAAVSRLWGHWAPHHARSWDCRLYEAKRDSRTKYLGRNRRSVR